MLTNVDRYKLLIIYALEVKQLQIEIDRKLDFISKNITIFEATQKSFDNHACIEAFNKISNNPGIKITESRYVKSSLEYKDVGISLHSYVGENDGNALQAILEDVIK